jgi:hypothetical protein
VDLSSAAPLYFDSKNSMLCMKFIDPAFGDKVQLPERTTCTESVYGSCPRHSHVCLS